jgi:excisionase family DNA binding protein
MPDDILTPQEAARLLGCNEKTLRLAIKAGRLQGVNVGSEHKPRWVLRRAEVEGFTLIHPGYPGAGRRKTPQA